MFVRYGLSVVLLLLLSVVTASAESTDPRIYCENEAAKKVEACLGAADPYRGGRQLGQADFSSLGRCSAQQEQEVSNCMADLNPGACGPAAQHVAQTNIDWVLSGDAGAGGTFADARANGQAPFDAVLTAQAHNAEAQRTIRRCRPWAERYIATHQQPTPSQSPVGGNAGLPTRQLSANDCGCIHVVPSGYPDAAGRPSYRVSNTCDGMRVSVGFVGTSDPMGGNLIQSYVASAGVLYGNQSAVVQAPGWRLVSLSSFTLTNQSSQFICRF